MMSFKVVLAFIVVATANAATSVTWTSATRTSVVSGAAGGDLVMSFTPATAVPTTGSVTITAGSEIFSSNAATACTLTSGAAAHVAVAACASVDGSTAATAACHCGTTGVVAAKGTFCDIVNAVGYALTTAKCTTAKSDGIVLAGAICSCGTNNLQTAATGACYLKADKTGVLSTAATAGVCVTAKATGLVLAPTGGCYCGSDGLFTLATQYCDNVLDTKGTILTTPKCANAVMGAATVAICSCGTDNVQVPAGGFCFVKADKTGVKSVTALPAVALTSSIVTSKTILTVVPAAQIGTGAAVLTCTDNLAVNGAAGAVTFKIVSTTDTTATSPVTGYTVTTATTAAPTAAPTPAGTKKYKDITQTATIGIAKADYTGMVEQLTERAMGITLGICSGNCTSWTTGYTMSSASARRASCTVTFTVGTPQTEAASTGVLKKGKAITKTTFRDAMVALKDADTAYKAVTAPSVSAVTTPKGGAVAASASTTTVGIFSALCLAVAALRQ